MRKWTYSPPCLVSCCYSRPCHLQYIPRNIHSVTAFLCFVVVIHWLIFPYPPGLLRWHCANLTIAPVPAKQPWWIWINTSCEIIMNDYITTTKQSTTKPCAYLLGYTVFPAMSLGVYTLRPDQNYRHFANDIFWCISLNENVWLSLKISLKFVSRVQINNVISLIQIMDWRSKGD